MAQFYNPDKKEVITLTELSRRFNASIPEGLEEINGYFKLHQGTYPEHGPYDSVVIDKIRKKNGKYYQNFKVIPEELESKKARLKAYVKQYLDETVQEKDYDSIENACSYASSTNPTFASEAQKAIKFRDDVWVKVYELLNSETLSEMDDAEFMSELPTMDWKE